MTKLEMLRNLNERLILLKARLRARDRLNEKFASANQSLDSERTRFDELSAILDKELEDVERLEGLSVAAMFHAVFGRRAERLNEERKEYLLAQLKLDECKDAIKSLELEVQRISTLLVEIGHLEVDDDYNAFLNDKEAFLVSNSLTDSGRELILLSETLADARSDKKEIDEAITAGDDALKELSKLVSKLETAEGLGCWDLLGGGTFVSYMKYSSIDEARACAGRVQALLRTFKREFSESQASSDKYKLDVDLTDLDMFVDILFDNWLSDCLSLSRVSRSMEQAKKAKSEISSLVSQLKKRRSILTARINEIVGQRQAMLEAPLSALV